MVVNATRIFCSALRISTLFGPWPLLSLPPNVGGLMHAQALPGYAFAISNLDSSFSILSLTSVWAAPTYPIWTLWFPYPYNTIHPPPYHHHHHLSLALQHLPLQWLWPPLWFHPAWYWSSLSCWSMLVTKSTNSWSPFIQIWASSTLLATRSKLERRPWKTTVKPCSRGNSSARLRNNSDSWPLRTVSTSEIETAREEASGETEEESSPNCRS